MKNKRIKKEFFLFTVLPFFIPFINEIAFISSPIQWTIIISVAFIDFYFAYRTLLEKENDLKNNYIQKSIRYAYSGAHEIIYFSIS